MKRLLFYSILAMFIVACASSNRISSSSNHQIADALQQKFLDSVFQYGLDHEALFTLLGPLKPMSSLVDFSFPIANTDTLKKTGGEVLKRSEHGRYLERLHFIQQAINAVKIPDIKVILVPYRSPYKKNRIIQLSAVRISSLDSLLKAKENFFGQFGLVPGANPELVVSVIEAADAYERLRGYGYLFGYPDYAVDFFVEASRTNDLSGKFVERNFFQIPTYAMKSGYFVYAYPKSKTPTVETDSVLYYKAGFILSHYKEIRSKYISKDSTLQAYKLLLDNCN